MNLPEALRAPQRSSTFSRKSWHNSVNGTIDDGTFLGQEIKLGAAVSRLLCSFRQNEQRAGTMSADTASGPTQDQLEILEYNFSKVNKHPDPTTLLLIAAEAGLSEEETQKWFKQRLAQWRKSEGLPSESRSVTD